jgi:hypothetical protein
VKIALVIFTRNERKNSERIYSKTPFKLIDNTYVIDGNSTDGTKDFWLNKGIKVFGQKYKGVGGAYYSAFKNIKEDALIFFHPDGNMDPKDITTFAKMLKKGHEFIVATRMTANAQNEEDDKLFKPRKWFCQALGLIANIIWSKKGNKTTDITQGYRAITKNAYKKMKINIPSAVAPDFEQIIKALKYNIAISEFPTKERKRVYGETTMPSFKTGWENIKVLLSELKHYA